MKRLNMYILSGILLLNIFSCEDFLNQTPRYNLTIDNAVTDYSSAKNVVNGIYAKLTASHLGGYLYATLSSQAGIYLNTESSVYYNMGYRQGSNDGSTQWQQLYTIVNATNVAIVLVSDLNDNLYPSIEEKERLIAEARCLRAFTYLQIHWLWSHWWEKADNPYGLIYRDEAADLANLQKSRLSVGDSYNRILEDLKYAEAHLNDFTSNRYVSRQFAKAMHAKLLLNRNWEGDYTEALKLVQEVKTQSPAAFSLETDLAKVYADGWDSKELLFSRYLGDLSNTTNNEYLYSYRLYYDSLLYNIPQNWIQEDPRYPIVTGIARAPEAWDERTARVYTKLYRKGRYNGSADKYTTYYFRFPELYLIEAELKFRLNPNDIAGALAPVNELRSKYTNPVLPPLSASNRDELSDLLYKEIVLTLFLENGSDWFASIRFQKNGKAWLYTLKPDITFSPEKYCWPIPDAEMINHTNKITQNPTLE
jgi:hypothetical protein